MRLKVNNTYCLGGCVLILALLCLISIGSPMYFEKQKARRESAVKERLYNPQNEMFVIIRTKRHFP